MISDSGLLFWGRPVHHDVSKNHNLMRKFIINYYVYQTAYTAGLLCRGLRAFDKRNTIII